MCDDYEVGYGKPPKKHQFKKGQSGNPQGRPKKSRSYATIMEEELNLQITVKEGNQMKTMHKSEAVVKQLVNQAIKGDVRSSKEVLRHMIQMTEPENNVAQSISANDQKIVAAFLKKQNELNND